MRFFRRWIGLTVFLCPVLLSAQAMPYLEVSVRDSAGSTQVILESSSELSTSLEKSGEYLMVRIRSIRPLRLRRPPFESNFIESFGWSRGSDFYMLNIKTKLSDFSFVSSSLEDPPRLVIDIVSVANSGESPDAAGNPPETDRNRSREGSASPSSKSAVSPESERKTIVIDPGHGGLEVGAEGKFGTLEKDVVLDIALKLKEVIERNLAYRVVLTRDRDFDKSLEERASLANNNKAFVFISIHANGFPRKDARGSETYFLNLNATDEEARRLAYMENNSPEMQKLEDESQDEIMMILWDMAQSAYLKQSSQLAELVQRELNTLLGTLNRGVKQAPFKVLTGVACPAILVEVAFISNPDEERQLIKAEFQNRIAAAIYNGLTKFLKLNLESGGE